jgi:hypothetical protein
MVKSRFIKIYNERHLHAKICFNHFGLLNKILALIFFLIDLVFKSQKFKILLFPAVSKCLDEELNVKHVSSSCKCIWKTVEGQQEEGGGRGRERKGKRGTKGWRGRQL